MRSSLVVAKPMLSILTSTRSLILYPTANFKLKCGLQIFQEDFGPGSDHTYQIGPSMLILTINLQVYSLCCLVSRKAVFSDPCYFWFASMIYFSLAFTILYLCLQMTPSALDQLPTVPRNSSCNMTKTCCFTGVLDPIYVWILSNVYIFHLEPTESLHITWTNMQSPKLNSHHDFGVIISDYLSWRNHYMYNII